MFITKLFTFFTSRSALQADPGPGTSISDVPDDALKIIFTQMAYGEEAVHFSRVCKKFNAIYVGCERPIDLMLSSSCKITQFVQKNKIGGFILSGQDTVITVDEEEYTKYPRITIWNSGKPPVYERGYFFFKPITFMAAGGTTTPYFAAAQYNAQGKIQVWNLQDQKKTIETALEREISCLSGSEEFLIAGFLDGAVGLYNFSDLKMVKELPPHNGSIDFIFVDSSIKRIMTLSGNNIKIWDSDNLNCVKEIRVKNLQRLSSYDPETKTVLGVSKERLEGSTIYLWSGQDGNEIAAYQCPLQKGEFTAHHLNSKASLLFGAYSYREENSKLCRSAIAVWDTKSNLLLEDFPALLREDTSANLHALIYGMDFDPDSGIIMTWGYDGINIWNLEKRVHIQRLNMPRGSVKKIQWIKDKQRLYSLVQDKLYLKDYSKKPFCVVGE